MPRVTVEGWPIDLLVRLARGILQVFGFVTTRASRRVTGRVVRRPSLLLSAGAMVAAASSIAAAAPFQCLKVGHTCPESAYGSGRGQPVVADTATWKIFRASRLGFAFSYPDNRKVVVGCRGSKNCVALTGRTTHLGDYLLAFEVFEGGLDTVAVDQAVFQKEGDHWIAKGRSGQHPVEPLSGLGWQGLKSVVDCGVSDASGFHGGAAECLWVVASNGRRSVVVDTQGTATIDQDIMRSILSLQFSAR